MKTEFFIYIQKFFFKGDYQMCGMSRKNTKKRSQHLQILFYLKQLFNFTDHA